MGGGDSKGEAREKKNDKVEKVEEEVLERREELRTPGPVDIVGTEEYEEGEISSSSEIEVQCL